MHKHPPAISATCGLTWWIETEAPHNSEHHRELEYLCIYTPWKVLLSIRASEFYSCSLCPPHPTAEVRVSTWERGKARKCVLSDEMVRSFPRVTLELQREICHSVSSAILIIASSQQHRATSQGMAWEPLRKLPL